MATKREQELVDLCFEIGMAAAKGFQNRLGLADDREQVANWIALNLRECGFDTAPMGMSHGVLREDR